MTVTYPADILSSFPGWSVEFSLAYRQEQSRSANGNTYVKDLGDPLWKATYQSRVLSPNELDYWRARLNALENGLQSFVAYPLSRCYPIAYPNGSWPTGGAFSGAGQVNSLSAKAVSLKGLPPAFRVSIGDYIQIGSGDLHQVVEAAVANGVGVTPEFEVRPYLWPTAIVNAAAKMAKPACIMTVVPDSVSSTAELSTGRGSITFLAMEAR